MIFFLKKLRYYIPQTTFAKHTDPGPQSLSFLQYLRLALLSTACLLDLSETS